MLHADPEIIKSVLPESTRPRGIRLTAGKCRCPGRQQRTHHLCIGLPRRITQDVCRQDLCGADLSRNIRDGRLAGARGDVGWQLRTQRHGAIEILHRARNRNCSAVAFLIGVTVQRDETVQPASPVTASNRSTARQHMISLLLENVPHYYGAVCGLSSGVTGFVQRLQAFCSTIVQISVARCSRLHERHMRIGDEYGRLKRHKV